MKNLIDILNTDSWNLFKGKLPFILGLDEQNAPCIKDLDSLKSLLIADTNEFQTKKLLQNILFCLSLKASPSELEIEIVDLKNYFLQDIYSNIKHIKKPLSRTLTEAFVKIYNTIRQVNLRENMSSRQLAKVPYKILIITGFEKFAHKFHWQLLENVFCDFFYAKNNNKVNIIFTCQLKKRELIELLRCKIKTKINFKDISLKQSNLLLLPHCAAELENENEFFFSNAPRDLDNFYLSYLSKENAHKFYGEKLRLPSCNEKDIVKIIYKINKQKQKLCKT